MKATKREATKIALPEGGFAFYLGDKNAKNVMVNFHGGGYVVCCGVGVMGNADALQKVRADVAQVFFFYGKYWHHYCLVRKRAIR
jgi:hypothetical protein